MARHDLLEKMLKYGYDRGDRDNVRSPYQTSGSYATRLFTGDNGGQYWVSLSGSDAEAGLGAQSRNGARFGDVFDLFVHFEHGGDVRAAVRAAAAELEDRSADFVEQGETSAPGSGSSSEPTAPAERPFRIKPAAVDVTALRPVRWVITGWVAAGEVFTFAGLPGVGKSTATAALALVAAGYSQAIGSNLPNDRPRRVAIVSEDSNQYARLLFAMIDAHKLDPHAVKRDVQLFDTSSLPRGEVRREFAHLVQQLTTDEPPLMILDTASASFELSDENANAEVAAVLAALKPVVTETGAAVWIISHAAKAVSREDSEITPRGAGAWMGDVHGTGSVFQDKTTPDSIFIRTLKNRAAVDFREIECVTRLMRHEVIDERGVVQNIGIRIATPMIPFVERAQRQAAARQDELQAEQVRARRAIVEFFRAAGPSGTFEGRPITGRVLEREDVRGDLSRELVRKTIDELERRLVLARERFVPADGKGTRERLVLVSSDWQETDE